MSNGYSLPPLQSIQSANGMGAGGGAGAGPNRSYQIFQPQQTLSFGAGSGSQLAPMNVYTPGSTMPQQERPTLPSFNHPSSSAGVHLPGSFPSSSNEDAEKKTFSSPAAARSGFEMPSSSASLRTGGLNMGDDLAERGTPRKFNSSFLD